MCAVSNVGDQWTPRFDPWKDQIWPYTPSPMPMYPGPSNPMPVFPSPGGVPFPVVDPNHVSRQEFDELKALVLQMKAELEAARAQDITNNEPDCEMEDKVALLKKVAKMVGVSLENVFPESK